MIAQEVIVAKSQEIHQVVDEVVTVVVDAVKDHTPIHEVEGKALKIFLQAGQKALQLLVDCLGNGDMGQEHQLPDGTTVKRSDEPEPRDYVSIFGKIDIERYVYARRKGQAIEFAAIDARLALSAGKFSYLLQDWDQSFAMEEPFGQTAKTVQRILGLKQYVDSLEHMNQEMAHSADMFQAILQKLMRHASIQTTMGYYADLDVDEMADDLWQTTSRRPSKTRSLATLLATMGQNRPKTKKAPQA